MIPFDIINLVIVAASEEGHNGFNWRFVGEHTVNFIILFGLLAYILKDPIRNFLSERRGIIGNQIEEAEKTIAEAKKSYEEYSLKLKNMDAEIKSLKDSIRKEGQVERAEILRQAESSSQKIKEEAKETIKLETAKARREIQSEVVSLALGIAENIIKQNFKESDQKNLMDDFIKTIKEEKKWEQSQH